MSKISRTSVYFVGLAVILAGIIYFSMRSYPQSVDHASVSTKDRVENATISAIENHGAGGQAEVTKPTAQIEANSKSSEVKIQERSVSFSIQLDCFRLYDLIAVGEKSDDPSVRENAANAKRKPLPRECDGLYLSRRDMAKTILAAAKSGDVKAQYYFAVGFPTSDIDGTPLKENTDLYVSYLPQLLSERVAAKDPQFMVMAAEYFSGCGLLLPSTSMTQRDWRPDFRAARQLLEEASSRGAILARRHKDLLQEFQQFTSPDVPPMQFRCP